MRKVLSLLFIAALFLILNASSARAVNLLCECTATPSGDCALACQNQTVGSKVCQCADGRTYPSDNLIQCDESCSPPETPQSSGTDIYKICNCSNLFKYSENNECYTPCQNSVIGCKEQNTCMFCFCRNSVLLPIQITGQNAPDECLNYCQTAKGTGALAGSVTETGLTVAPPVPTAPATQTITQKPYEPSVLIPGLDLTDIQVTTTGTGKIDVPWIAQYIVAIYKYSIGLASILAIAMVIIAGFLYLTSAGNPQRIGQAKNFIIGAISGVVILASAYMILNLISPELTRLGAIQIEEIDKEELAWQESFKEAEEAAIIPPGMQVDPSSQIATQPAKCTDPTKASKPSGAGNTSYLGQLDCNAVRQRNISQIKYIVLHDGAGAARNVSNWTKRCEEKGYKDCPASHYTINRSGAIYQTMGEEKVAIHAQQYNSAGIGVDLENDLPSSFIYSKISDCLKECQAGNYPCAKHANDKAYAINRCTPSKTDAQYASLNILIANIRARIPGVRVVAHCQGGVHSDPRNFDWSKLGFNAADYPDTAWCKFYPTYANRVKELADKIFGP
ncbi:MAG: N-acetylmuramoyl-L-alanine amidase [Patescibacteria group bacterium]